MKNIRNISFGLLFLSQVFSSNQSKINEIGDVKKQNIIERSNVNLDLDLENVTVVNDIDKPSFGSILKTITKMQFASKGWVLPLATSTAINFYATVYLPVKNNEKLVCWNSETKAYEDKEINSYLSYYWTKGFKEPAKFNFKNTFNDLKTKRFWLAVLADMAVKAGFNYYTNANNVKTFTENYQSLLTDCKENKIKIQASPDSLYIVLSTGFVTKYFNNEGVADRIFRSASYKKSVLATVAMCMAMVNTTDYKNSLLQDVLAMFKIKMDVVL